MELPDSKKQKLGVSYNTDTEFLVQVGKGKKGSYRTKYTVVGQLGKAVALYSGINLAPGYKKRLLVPTAQIPIIVQEYRSAELCC